MTIKNEFLEITAENLISEWCDIIGDQSNAIEWDIKIGFHEEIGAWYIKSFEGTPSETNLVRYNRRDIITLLMDHLSAIFSFDSGCVDETEFWKVINECTPDIRRYCNNKDWLKKRKK